MDNTTGGAITWQAAAALEILGAWRGQAVLLRATLEAIIREKGGGKYEKYCQQLLGIITRLLSRISSALAEYSTDNPPREFLNGEDINAVTIVLFSAEQLLLCLGDLYLLQ